jgi:hypothetical protein
MNKDNLKKALECRANMKPPFDCEHCEYLDRSDDWGTCDAKKLGADALELIHELESMNVSASGNGTAIGTVRGGLVIQHAKEIHNVEHIDELKL